MPPPGTVVSGEVTTGQAMVIADSGRTAKVERIVTFDGGLCGLVGGPGGTHQMPPLAAATLAPMAPRSAAWPASFE